ncbi:NAD-dependent epimerase/dehydratase family protein [bacterium]|nr:NAD-dependent epimerase/dehydratase family protein [bacterium]
MSKIFVLGGDGFCGWPAALHLSSLGHDVHILDSLVRREIDDELGVQSLTPIASMSERLEAWQELGNPTIRFHQVDIADDYETFAATLDEHRPDVVVHLAEQRAAPYSMRSAFHKRYTVENNTRATHNLLCALVDLDLDAHIVHLGTMGVYGYGTAGLAIPEGYLEATVEAEGGPKQIEFLYPADPGSVYHMTKTLDALMFSYYNKNDRVRITDLHQGIVWGGTTAQTSADPRLVNRFDYDGDYGTVLNRFLVQAAIGHPLTVHGTGQQTRAFIHIRDSVRCIQLAVDNPPQQGERVEIFNQATETHRLITLAEMVATLTEAEIRFYRNPRNEAPVNELTVTNEKFLALGLEPTTLEDGLLSEVIDIIRPHLDRIDRDRIPATALWTKDNELDSTGSSSAGDRT